MLYSEVVLCAVGLIQVGSEVVCSEVIRFGFVCSGGLVEPSGHDLVSDIIYDLVWADSALLKCGDVSGRACGEVRGGAEGC